MRKERKPDRTQPHLFQPPAVTPSWSGLPPEVQQRVWPLLLQLLHEARHGRGLARGKQTRSDQRPSVAFER